MGFWDALGKGFKSSDDAMKATSDYAGNVAKEAVKPENVAKIATGLSKDYLADHLGLPDQDAMSYDASQTPHSSPDFSQGSQAFKAFLNKE